MLFTIANLTVKVESINTILIGREREISLNAERKFGRERGERPRLS
jgi:hypothetical protein